jgi:hypothetical protein
MPKKTRALPVKKEPHIVGEDQKIIMVGFGGDPYVLLEIRRTWLRRNRKFLEALLAASRWGGRHR